MIMYSYLPILMVSDKTRFFLARIYTIYFDSGDVMLLANFGISTILSSAVMAAAWFYKSKPKYQKLVNKEK